MKVLLHIGMSKAGSSAIQAALISARELIEQAGFHYPEIGRGKEGAHFGIFHEIRELDRYDLLLRAIEEREATEKVVISCEGFWLLNQRQVENLIRHLSDVECEVVLYLRNPISYLCSSYRQGIKKKGRFESCAQYIERSRPTVRLNYPYLLNLWGEKCTLRVRVYENIRTKLVSDFFSIMGITVPVDGCDQVVVNKTPSDDILRLLMILNRILPKKFSRRASTLLVNSNLRIPCLKPIDDTSLRVHGKSIIQSWETQSMARYLSERELLLLSEVRSDERT